MKKYTKILLCIAGIVAGIYFFLGTNGDGVIRDVVDEVFFVKNEYDMGKIHYAVTAPYWDRIYTLSFLLIIIVFFLFYYLLDRRITKDVKKHDEKVIRELEEVLSNFRDGKEYPKLKDQFAPLEAVLYQIKTKEEKQIALIEKQTQQKNDLIAYLAHDMKTPLASVIGYLNLLNDVHDIPDEQREVYIRITLDKANRLESLIDEFFDITRFNLQDIAISRGRIEMHFLFEQLCEQFYPILMKTNKKITMEIPEDLIYYGDADKLARAFNNILKNAISYSYPDTVIRIHSEITSDELIFYFHNQGDEIPQQKLALIFEKFYRLDAARSTHSGGAGLGLAIAKEIITAHDGTISAQSSIKETVFIVRLPMQIQDELLLGES